MQFYSFSFKKELKSRKKKKERINKREIKRRLAKRKKKEIKSLSPRLRRANANT